jgi:hypothetical protein
MLIPPGTDAMTPCFFAGVAPTYGKLRANPASTGNHRQHAMKSVDCERAKKTRMRHVVRF